MFVSSSFDLCAINNADKADFVVVVNCYSCCLAEENDHAFRLKEERTDIHHE